MAKDTNTPTAAPAKTCFVMMPISDVEGYPVGHFREVYQYLIKPAATSAGYTCELATSTSASHMIQLDVARKVVDSDLCICDMSTNNGNVMFEYGLRQAFDKPTVLLRDERTGRLFDTSGFRDIVYQSGLRPSDIENDLNEIKKAIEDTVKGSSDSGQVFSLIKLLQLTKAALPASEGINREDARYKLLAAQSLEMHKKIDHLAGAVAKLASGQFERPTSLANSLALSSLETLRYQPNEPLGLGRLVEQVGLLSVPSDPKAK